MSIVTEGVVCNASSDREGDGDGSHETMNHHIILLWIL